MARERRPGGGGDWSEFGGNMPPGGLSGNRFRLARALARQGRSEEFIRNRLGNPNHPMRPAEIGRATSQASTWRDRMQSLERQGGDRQIPRAWMTRNTNLDSAYQWIVQVELLGRSRGGGRRDPSQFRTVAVNSARNLTLDQIAELALATWNEMASYRADNRRANSITKTLILTAERRSG